MATTAASARVAAITAFLAALTVVTGLCAPAALASVDFPRGHGNVHNSDIDVCDGKRRDNCWMLETGQTRAQHGVYGTPEDRSYRFKELVGDMGLTSTHLLAWI